MVQHHLKMKVTMYSVCQKKGQINGCPKVILVYCLFGIHIPLSNKCSKLHFNLLKAITHENISNELITMIVVI